MSADNWLVKNLGLHPSPNYNFMLRVEALFDLPCKAVHAFTKANEFEYIQEGGLNDYVHMRRKPITQPFTFEVERYVGVDYFDPLPLGSEPILPVCLLVFSSAAYSGSTTVFLRMYTFTGCTVMEKNYGDLDAEKSGLYVERTKIAYRECVIITNPDSGASMAGTMYTEDTSVFDKDTGLYTSDPNKFNGHARHVPGDIAGTTAFKHGKKNATTGKYENQVTKDAGNDNVNRGRYDGMPTTTFSKATMLKGKYAAEGSAPATKATPRLWTPIDEPPNPNPTPPTPLPPGSTGLPNPNRENRSARRVGDEGFVVTAKSGAKIYDANGREITQYANDNVNRGRYSDAESKYFALHPVASENPNDDVNRGRYDGLKTGQKGEWDQMLKGKFAAEGSAPAEKAKSVVYKEGDDTTERHRTLSLAYDPDDVNRGRYDGMKTGEKGDKDKMLKGKFAAEGSAPAEKAKSVVYKEGDESTESHRTLSLDYDPDDVNRGRYDGLKTGQKGEWDQMLKGKFAAEGSAPAEKAKSVVYKEGDESTESHRTLSLDYDPDDLNTGRYDGSETGQKLTRDQMLKGKFAAPGSAPAPKAKAKVYVDGQANTMSHRDIATYLS